MNKQNTEILLNRFPIFYSQYYLPMDTTCMCWGFDHQDGWFRIIWDLSLAIEEELNYSWFTKTFWRQLERLSYKWNQWISKFPYWISKRLCWNYSLFKVTQVKEKFATLRFYTNWETEEIGKLIEEAEERSSHTCEICGAFGEIGKSGGWLSTRCATHKK